MNLVALRPFLPGFRTPPGVTLRMLEPGEVVMDPVLVCEACRSPQIHDRSGVCDIQGRAKCRCRACGGWRMW